MAKKKWLELEDDFETWSGGFPPESDYQIIVYVNYANLFPHPEQEVRDYLMDWCEQGDPDFAESFRSGWFGKR